MKKNSTFWLVLFALLGTLMLSACGISAVEPVAALGQNNVPDNAVAEVDTPLPEPTAEPAATLFAASPTPSRIEFSVQNDRFEVQVVQVEKPTHVNPGAGTVFTPGEGNMFLGLGIKVTNLTGADIPLKWTDVYLVNKYQDKWYPMWGAYQKTNRVIDPLMVEVLEFVVHPEVDPDANLYMADNGYLRAIYRLPKDNLYYYFGFADLPLIEINYRYQ